MASADLEQLVSKAIAEFPSCTAKPQEASRPYDAAEPHDETLKSAPAIF